MNATLYEILKNSIAATIRAGLVFVGAWLVKSGLITADQQDDFLSQGTEIAVGIVMALAALAWSYWQKIRANRKVDVALTVPPMPREEFERTMDEGIAPEK